MIATRILQSLEALDLTGTEADAAARMGFLEWAFTDPGQITADKAVLALSDPAAQQAESAAAQAFVRFLHDATCQLHPQRRRGRAARLH